MAHRASAAVRLGPRRAILPPARVSPSVGAGDRPLATPGVTPVAQTGSTPTVDLAAMTLRPSEIDPPDYGLVEARFVPLGERASYGLAEGDSAGAAAAAARLRGGGWRGDFFARYEQAWETADPWSDTAGVIQIWIEEFASAHAAAETFARSTQEEPGSHSRTVAVSRTIGDETAMVALDDPGSEWDLPVHGLVLSLRRGRLTGGVGIYDYGVRPVGAAVVEGLGDAWLSRADAMIAGSVPALGRRAVRLDGAGMAHAGDDDRYVRRDGEDVSEHGLGRWDLRNQMRVFGAATDVYSFRRPFPAAEPGPFTQTGSLLRFADDGAAAAWFAALRRTRRIPGLTRVMDPNGSAAGLGDESFGLVYDGSGFDPFGPPTIAMVVRVGREGAVVMMSAGDTSQPPLGFEFTGWSAPPFAVVEEIAAAQVAALATGRAEPLPFPDPLRAWGR